MARVKGPLMSMDARGTFAREMRFRHQSGQVVAYRAGAPGSRRPARPSTSQAQVRARFSAAKARWWALAPERRAAWRAYAAGLDTGLSGWNCFLSHVLRGGDCEAPQGPPLPDPWTYIPPAGHRVLSPGHTWVPDLAYPPPTHQGGVIRWPTATR